ncbi:MAG: amidohydrolase family protein, partial [Thermoplasmata archaeon]
MAEPADILIRNISELLTLSGDNASPRKGKGMTDLGIINNGAVAISTERIIAVGRTEEVENKVESSPETRIINAEGKTVMPGFIDPHTHLIFAGSRENELHMKLQGKSYLDILNSGGGILRTVRETRAAGSEELLFTARKRLDRMLALGTTTVEAKSGYGLDMDCEIKSLEVINKLDREHAVDLVPTYLGAHAIPPEFKDDSDGYVQLVTEEVLPKVAERKLARFCDVFCEKGVFSVAQSKRILLTGKD